jgi:hypothetical protein
MVEDMKSISDSFQVTLGGCQKCNLLRQQAITIPPKVTSPGIIMFYNFKILNVWEDQIGSQKRSGVKEPEPEDRAHRL